MTRTALLLLLVLALPVSAGEDLSKRLAGLVASGNYRGALQVAEQAIADAPESVPAWQYRAYALHRLGDVHGAKAAYERTLLLDPKNWWAKMNLGHLLADQGQVEAGVAAVREAVDLNPGETAIRARLSMIYREAGDYLSAVSAVRQALAAAVDPGWCHTELGYLYFAVGEREKSRNHWRMARRLGADELACEHMLRLLDWEEPSGDAEDREEVRHRRLGVGPEWRFMVSGIEVRTRVGPKLPAVVRRRLEGIADRHADLLGLNGVRAGAIRLTLSRTLEEHEAHRKREFPQGFTGRAFFVPRPNREVDLYVAWTQPGLLGSLAHELAHAMLRMRSSGPVMLPAWLDEGIATYLEEPRVRDDLLAELTDEAVLPWNRMLGAQLFEFTGTRARARYAQAWCMVHFLLEGRKRGGPKRLRQFLDRMSPGRAPARGDPYREIYGKSWPELELEWLRYLEKLTK